MVPLDFTLNTFSSTSMGRLIIEILSRPGALLQDTDGSFFVLTDAELAHRYQTSSTGNSYDPCLLFTPTFFATSPRDTPSQSAAPESLSHEKPYSYYCLHFRRDQWVAGLQSLEIKGNFSFHPDWREQPFAQFESDFTTVQDKIHAGAMDKAVLMSFEEADISPTLQQRAALLFELTRNCSENLIIYGHWKETSGVLGATPELLFHRKGRNLLTMALAGTLSKRHRVNDKGEPLSRVLLNDSKERHEHQLVVDDLTEKLNRFLRAVGSPEILVRGPEVLELPHLLHLHTQLEVFIPETLSDDGNFDWNLLKLLHPTSALGLRSKSLPWSWLRSLEGHKNLGHFGAPLGFSLPNRFLCLVGIRNIEWEGSKTRLRAGCGVVAQSKLLNEWQELRAKRDSVKALLGLNP